MRRFADTPVNTAIAVLAAAASLALAVFLVVMATVLSTHWLVFAVPLVSLAGVQIVAFNAPKPLAKRVFAATDVLYYLIIGVAVGLGTRYLPDLPDLLHDEAMAQYRTALTARESARSRLPDAARLVEAAAERVAQGEKLVQAIDPALRVRCMARMLDDRALGRPGQPGDPPFADLTGLTRYPPGCEMLGLEDVLAGDVARLRGLQRELDSLGAAATREIVPPKARALFDTDVESRLLQFWAPMLILVGATLKLGKSSFAIRELATPTGGPTAAV